MTDDLRGKLEIPEGLGPDDQVTFTIGKIVRIENEAEHSLRLLFHELAGDKAARVMVPRDLARQIDQVRKLVKLGGLNDQVTADALDALAGLASAHTRRNRVVHDWFVMRNDGDAPVFENSAKGIVYDGSAPDHWSFGDFEDCYLDLRFSAIRVSSLQWFLAFRDLPRLDQDRDTLLLGHLETLAGRIRVTGEYSWEYTSIDYNALAKEYFDEMGARLKARFEHWHDSHGPLSGN